MFISLISKFSEKYESIERQIETDLIPVLHREYNFSLREIYDFILSFKK